MKVLTFARRIAHSEGFKPITNQNLEYLVWERTGYPAFWTTDNILAEFEAQLRQAFQDIKNGNSKKWSEEKP